MKQRSMRGLITALALVTLIGVGSAGCPGHVPAQTPASVVQATPQLNRVLAGKALDIITDVAKIGAQVRETVRALNLPADKMTAFDAKYKAYQGVMDKAIDDIGAASHLVDPALKTVGDAGARVVPFVNDLVALVRDLHPPQWLEAVLSGFVATLDAVVAFGR